ncbi:MAG TPA: tetratricopeptide repeat protein [Cyclobacteriaceae bacterium]|nr:tetratricopeptide repeat protein [Cyclobacteriaceae bacterium]
MHRVLLIGFFLLVFVQAWSQQEPKWRKWEVLGDSAAANENFKTALKHYNKAIKQCKFTERTDYSLFYKRALVHLNLDLLQRAVADIDRFIEQYPFTFQAYILKAYLLRMLDEPNEAVAVLDKAQEFSPDNPDIIKWKAEIYLELDLADAVIKELLSLPKQFRDPQTQVMLGFAYYQLDKNDSALYYLNQALRMDPFFYPALMYTISVHLQEGNYDLAMQYIDRAMDIDSTDASLLFYKGIILAEKDELDEACKCLNRAFYRGIDDAAEYLKQYCFNEGK